MRASYAKDFRGKRFGVSGPSTRFIPDMLKGFLDESDELLG